MNGDDVRGRAPRTCIGPAAAERSDAELFEKHAGRLLAVVGRAVRTSPMNVEDACAFAWLQLLRHHPRQETAFGWLCTTAVREAIKLDRRARSGVELDGLGGDRACTA